MDNPDKEIPYVSKPFEFGMIFGTFPERVLQHIDTQDRKRLTSMRQGLQNSLAECCANGIAWVDRSVYHQIILHWQTDCSKRKALPRTAIRKYF